MKFLTRIANSSFLKQYCRWPSAHVAAFYWVFIAVGSLVTIVQSSVSHYRSDSSHALVPILGMAAGEFLALAILGLMYFLLGCVLYRIGTNIYGGIRAFIAWLPGAWQRTSQAISAVAAFISAIPALVKDVFTWIHGRPAWWRSLNGREKTSVVISSAVLFCYAALLAVLFPWAHHLSTIAPQWLPMSDAPYLLAMTIDMLLVTGCASVLLMVLALLASALSRWSRS